jgi:hypothetical protein
LTVYFVVYTLAVKKNQGRFRHVGSNHSLVSSPTSDGHSVGIVRLRTNAPEFFYILYSVIVSSANGSVKISWHRTEDNTHVTKQNVLDINPICCVVLC